MNAEQNVRSRYQKNHFSKLRLYYLLALSAIALSIILGQFFVQHHLHEQESDARVINVAGRQRMLGQQIAKIALELSVRVDTLARRGALERLTAARHEWQVAQQALRYGNDTLMLPANTNKAIDSLLAESMPHFEAIVDASGKLHAQLESQLTIEYTVLEPLVMQVLAHERPFLQTMENIVWHFEQVAASKVTRLKRTEYLLLGISLMVILLEILFIFIPTTKRISDTLQKLIKSEQDAQQMSKEIGELYDSLEASYKKISVITLPVSPPRLIAKADKGGNLTEIAPHYSQEITSRPIHDPATVAHLFGLQGDGADDFMETLIDAVAEGQHWNQEIVFLNGEGTKKYMDVHVVPIYSLGGEIEQLHVMAADMTQRRMAEQNVYQKDLAEIERKVNEQKFRSILVLEGQEEERKRIAMNIHDGIGQMLTSLKFHMASIDLNKPPDAARKLDDINTLIREIIQEVRRVTFNLKPPVLSDYGLAAGLKNLVHEIDRLSKTTITFDNPGNFSKRLSSKVENNVFRIVQEALNNAIKYSGSEQVEVLMEHDESSLSISVKDYGCGFENKSVEVFNADFGHGFLNMHERAAYINGTLSIESQKGMGTIVKLFVPLGQN